MNKNIFTQKDPVADAVKSILDNEISLKVEALKGDQSKIDANRNKKIDAQDFAILRGEKKAKKEMKEGWAEMEKAAKEREAAKGTGNFDKKKISTGTVYTRKHKPEKAKDDKEVNEVHIYGGEWANHVVKTSTGTHKVYGPVDKDEMQKHLHSQPGGEKHYGKVQSMEKDSSPIEPTHDPKSNRSYNEEVVREDEQIEERSSKLDEAAKWRSTSVAKKITNPEDESGSSYDYHHDNPRSTGILRATSDTPKKYGSLYSRQQADPIKSGSRKGMITKKHAQRLKDKIRSGMHNEETLTSGETAERERIVKGMKKSLAGFKARYGERAKSVMYATATKAAKKD